MDPDGTVTAREDDLEIRGIRNDPDPQRVLLEIFKWMIRGAYELVQEMRREASPLDNASFDAVQ
ncbi:MAG: hypothetical protein ACM3SX_13980, partial [Deltaproteobacteria bacterium]